MMGKNQVNEQEFGGALAIITGQPKDHKFLTKFYVTFFTLVIIFFNKKDVFSSKTGTTNVQTQ